MLLAWFAATWSALTSSCDKSHAYCLTVHATHLDGISMAYMPSNSESVTVGGDLVLSSVHGVAIAGIRKSIAFDVAGRSHHQLLSTRCQCN
eukprot:SAG31_NODE_32492_length_355_cov_0.804688_1_plen_90_part_10